MIGWLQNWKGFERKHFGPFEVLFRQFLGETEENQKTAMKIAGVPIEIRTQHLLNASLQYYRYTNRFVEIRLKSK